MAEEGFGRFMDGHRELFPFMRSILRQTRKV